MPCGIFCAIALKTTTGNDRAELCWGNRHDIYSGLSDDFITTPFRSSVWADAKGKNWQMAVPFTDITIGPKFILNVSCWMFRPKHDTVDIIYSPSCWWNVGWSFVVHKTFLGLHSETVALFTERFCIIAETKACLYASFVCSHWTKQRWRKSCNVAMSIEVLVSPLLFDE